MRHTYFSKMSSAEDGDKLEAVEAHGGVRRAAPGRQAGPVVRSARRVPIGRRLTTGQALRTVPPTRLRAGIRHADDGGVSDLLQLVGRLRRRLRRDDDAGGVVVGRVDGEGFVGDHFAAVVVGEMMKRRGGNGGGGLRLVVVGRWFGGGRRRRRAGLAARLQTGLSSQVPDFKFLNKADPTVIAVELILIYILTDLLTDS